MMTDILKNMKREFPEEINNAMDTIIVLMKDKKFKVAEKRIAHLILQLIHGISNGSMRPEIADKVFTFLYVYISDKYENVPLSSKLADLLIEGMTLHHIHDGTGYGPDLKKMEIVASNIADSST
jgi:hypothetical protein